MVRTSYKYGPSLDGGGVAHTGAVGVDDGGVAVHGDAGQRQGRHVHGYSLK